MGKLTEQQVDDLVNERLNASDTIVQRGFMELNNAGYTSSEVLAFLKDGFLARIRARYIRQGFIKALQCVDCDAHFDSSHDLIDGVQCHSCHDNEHKDYNAFVPEPKAQIAAPELKGDDDV